LRDVTDSKDDQLGVKNSVRSRQRNFAGHGPGVIGCLLGFNDKRKAG